MLTLLAQRRELCAETIKQQLEHGKVEDVDTFYAAALYPPVSNATIEAERRDLQRELTLGLESAQPMLATERIRKTMAAAGSPLAGEASQHSWYHYL